jgi:hypothetical protein
MPKYLQYCVSLFFLIFNRIGIDGLLLAPASLFPNYFFKVLPPRRDVES